MFNSRGKINPNYPELFYIINNKELIAYDLEKGQTSNKLVKLLNN